MNKLILKSVMKGVAITSGCVNIFIKLNETKLNSILKEEEENV